MLKVNLSNEVIANSSNRIIECMAYAHDYVFYFVFKLGNKMKIREKSVISTYYLLRCSLFRITAEYSTDREKNVTQKISVVQLLN